MRFLAIALVAALLSCGASRGPSSPRGQPASPVLIADGDRGIYEKSRTSVSFRTLRDILGPSSVLSESDRGAAWEDVAGKQVYWSAFIYEIGELYPSTLPVKLRSDLAGTSWDTLAYFDPEFAEALRHREVGNAVAFTGVLQRYERTPDGIQVTIQRVRLRR